MNDLSKLQQHLDAASGASVALTEELRSYATTRLAEAKAANVDVAAHDWGDALFGNIWKLLHETGTNHNKLYDGVFSFAHAIENLTRELGKPDWTRVHKGAHFYNVGLTFTYIMEADRAFKFFLLADEQDERNKGTGPGDLFRSKDIFQQLRERFFAEWFQGIHADFHHDGLGHDARLELVGRLLAALPGRQVLARCHLGVFRACFLWHQKQSGLGAAVAEHVMAVEDLAVLTEAASRMLQESKTAYDNDNLTFGNMLQASEPLGRLGFHRKARMELADEPSARQTLTDASSGDKAAMKAVVLRFRNLTAHPGAPPTWCLDAGVLSQVIAIQLDFASTVAAAFEAANGSLSPTAAPTAAPTVGGLVSLGGVVCPASLPLSSSYLSGSAGPTRS